MSGLVFREVPHQFTSMTLYNILLDGHYIGTIKRAFGYSFIHKQHTAGKFELSPTIAVIDPKLESEIDKFVTALNVALRLAGKI